MRTNTEIEYKTLISEEQFTRLLTYFQIDTTVEQTNTYFDTADHKLKAMKVACRIRVNDMIIEATVKEHTEAGILEYNHTLEKFDPSVFKSGEFKALFARLTVDEPLIEVGKAITLRHLVYEKTGELCFDRTTFKDHIDYELEYEVMGDPEVGFKRFMDILALENIRYVPSISKMQRATA